ncbi:MAG: hypothetical protein C0475_05590 [Planctomyces sp.]|nr:hypothetical protein [Planctomyces sp.]MBA4038798.1 hypothetical protein [Planctomyces sp.]
MPHRPHQRQRQRRSRSQGGAGPRTVPTASVRAKRQAVRVLGALAAAMLAVLLLGLLYAIALR